jgi:hypothetical protein
MQATPNIIKDVISFLESKEHTCMMYNMSKKILEWCNKDECVRTKAYNDMAIRNKEACDYALSLKAEGHTCVMYLERYPVQISWCNQETCIKK